MGAPFAAATERQRGFLSESVEILFYHFLECVFFPLSGVVQVGCQEPDQVDGIPGRKRARSSSSSRFAAAALPWLNPYVPNTITAQ